jgi:hypothetical protein
MGCTRWLGIVGFPETLYRIHAVVSRTGYQPKLAKAEVKLWGTITALSNTSCGCSDMH